MKKIQNKVMLITYPDSLGGDLKGLRHVLDTSLKGAAGSIHILPFFPSAATAASRPPPTTWWSLPSAPGRTSPP